MSLLDGEPTKSDDAAPIAAAPAAATEAVAAPAKPAEPATPGAVAAAAAKVDAKAGGVVPKPTNKVPAAGSPANAAKPATATTRKPTASPGGKPVPAPVAAAKPKAAPAAAAKPGAKPAAKAAASGAPRAASPKPASPASAGAVKDEKHAAAAATPVATGKPATVKARKCAHCKYVSTNAGRFCLNCGRSIAAKAVPTKQCKFCSLISVAGGTACPGCSKAYGAAPPRKELGPCDNHNDAFAYQTCSNCDAKVCDACVKRRDIETGKVVCVECARQQEVCDSVCFICSFCASTCDRAAKMPTGSRKNYDFTAGDDEDPKSSSKAMSRD